MLIRVVLAAVFLAGPVSYPQEAAAQPNGIEVDDGPASDSSPGDAFHTALNTTLDASTTPVDDNRLSNDDRGFPMGIVSSFGE